MNLFQRCGVVEGLLYSIFLYRNDLNKIAKIIVENCDYPQKLEQIIMNSEPEI